MCGGLVHERLEAIRKLIDSKGIVKANALSAALGVSIETVRRDLEYLEKKGLLKRVYGGAIANGKKGVERGYSSRECLNQEEKISIARRTAELVNDGDAVVIDLGTTALEVARCLQDKKSLTVLTNSLPVGMELVRNKSCRVYMLGGQLRAGDYSTSGYLANRGLSEFRVDKAIISASGISSKNGITDYHVEEADVRRKMIEIAEQVIFVADSSKFGLSAFVQVCELSDVDVCVTDWRVSEEARTVFDNLGTRLIVAPCPENFRHD